MENKELLEAFLKYGVSPFRLEIDENKLTKELEDKLKENNWSLVSRNDYYAIDILTYEKQE